MAVWAWQLITMIASVLISAALAPKPTRPEPATLQDFDIPQIDEGTPQCVVFGECWTSDWQVLGKGNFRTKDVKTKSSKK